MLLPWGLRNVVKQTTSKVTDTCPFETTGKNNNFQCALENFSENKGGGGGGREAVSIPKPDKIITETC